MKTLGIVGFGRFGQLVARHAAGKFKARVCDKKPMESAAKKLGARFTSLEECAAQEMVLFCTPISKLEGALEESRPFIRPGALVMDACTVKKIPQGLLEKHVPKHALNCATHPMFGPDTAGEGFKGKKVALCGRNEEGVRAARRFWESLGAECVATTAKRHDLDMAKSVCLMHFLGHALKRMGVGEVRLSTPTHERLLELVGIATRDSRQLFLDMHRFNPEAKKTRERLVLELLKLEGELT